MSNWNTEELIAQDKSYLWHPFTNMSDWCAPENDPPVLVKGDGAILWDSRGREYIDGNSSIWTNIHGHNHPRINAAIREQLERVAHTSFLGATHPLAIRLARELVQLFPEEKFGRVFFSDDGSTGIEAALRLVSQYWKLEGKERPYFISFREGYHGDTAGAASLGAATMFNGAMPEWRAPVRPLSSVAELTRLTDGESVAAVVIEPVIQGAAGMKLWPAGTLRALRDWCDRSGALLIADEVMTGFGRTGKMFACEHEATQPDIYVFAKGLTGGYLPLAVTLVSHRVFQPFQSGARDATFFYGHSYTANALGCAAALASLEIFREEEMLNAIQPRITQFAETWLAMSAEGITARHIGLVGAVEMANSAEALTVCALARQRGLLTRPIREVVVLMPPLCVKESELGKALQIIRQSVSEVTAARS